MAATSHATSLNVGVFQVLQICPSQNLRFSTVSDVA